MSKFKKHEEKKFQGMSSIKEILSTVELVPTTSNLDSKVKSITDEIRDVAANLEEMINKEKLDRTNILKAVVEAQKLTDKSVDRILTELKTTKYYTDLNFDTLRAMILFTLEMVELQSKFKINKISKFLKCNRKGHDYDVIEKFRGIGIVYKCKNCNTIHFDLEDSDSHISGWKYNITANIPYEDGELEELN